MRESSQAPQVITHWGATVSLPTSSKGGFVYSFHQELSVPTVCQALHSLLGAQK